MTQPVSSPRRQALSVQSKVGLSISRRSRRRRSKHLGSSDSSVSSAISSTYRDGSDLYSDMSSFFGEESSICGSYNPSVASSEPIEEDIMKLTLDVPSVYYGEYRTIVQNEFFMECMINCSGSALVHFFDENNPTSIELDSILGQLATKYTACKFLRIDSTNTPFVCKKLNITSFPTILAIRNKTILEVISEFDGSCIQEEVEKKVFRSLRNMNRP